MVKEEFTNKDTVSLLKTKISLSSASPATDKSGSWRPGTRRERWGLFGKTLRVRLDELH